MTLKQPHQALDTSTATMVRLAERPSKVQHESLVDPDAYATAAAGLDGLVPPILKGADLMAVADAWAEAVKRERAVVLGMGAHVIKVGLSRLVIDLLSRGWLHALAGTGAVGIHDLEMAIDGHTSEDVAEGLPTGAFGMAEDTGTAYWEAVALATRQGYGLGQAIGAAITQRAPRFQSLSILAAAYEREIPATLHVTLGADTAHMHPRHDGAALGAASLRDFHVLADIVTRLDDGGLYINLGSAVTLPEVFLKAINIARNVTGRPHRIVTANFDMIQHYRPLENVVRRPTAADGRGYAITGHHEILFPLLYAMVRDRLA
jgi:hypothetical protein